MNAAATLDPVDVARRTVAEARRTLTAALRDGGIETPELDARVLIGHALGLDHAALAGDPARLLSHAEEDAIATLGRRRLAHEPVARIVGSKEFWSLALAVDHSTLVPRPETETVVEAVLDIIDRESGRRHPYRIIDLGTGSGAILLALLSELPNAFGVGTDINPRALQLARANARKLGIGRAVFVACDMANSLCGPFDIIVSNPPYVVSDELGALQPEVRLFDPSLALDGGPDGLSAYRTIATAAPQLLAPDGLIVAELGAGQETEVAALFAAVGLAPMGARPDLGGVGRALVVRNKA
ncbi:MAG TPA: peptide chain release factor N(5)-glutamine methyltransferase [Xanthobacteraceae bacterium]|jgi:release factor glutamine methyltransferase|nr:peptide chain release factor N(5)-glutamine methyltransferase [Xanthobacteraceae bacterium]